MKKIANNLIQKHFGGRLVYELKESLNNILFLDNCGGLLGELKKEKDSVLFRGFLNGWEWEGYDV